MINKSNGVLNMETGLCVPPALSGRPYQRLASGAQRRDMSVLEIATAKALREWTAAVAGLAADDCPRFAPPYTTGQIEIARTYVGLVEWRAGSGLRAQSLTGAAGGGSATSSYIDTFVQQGQLLAGLQAAIGDEVILSIRRNMDRGNTRRSITARAAIDAVLLQGLDVSAVLKAHGWTPDVKSRKALRAGLCAALDRMQGLRDRLYVWRAEGEADGFRLPAAQKGD